MTYSYTEKKRIRKSFAKRANVLDVPFLLATQLESYTQFLQVDIPVAQRRVQGLEAAFASIFPIVAHSGAARLEFVEYRLGEPAFDVKECQQRGLTFASPLRAKVRLVILDRESSTEKIKEVKDPDEEWSIDQDLKEQLQELAKVREDFQKYFPDMLRILREPGNDQLNAQELYDKAKGIENNPQSLVPQSWLN